MFKFLKDIAQLKKDVKEIFEEIHEDYVSDYWSDERRTLRKRVDDLENIVDKLLAHLKLEPSETPPVPEVPSTWVIKKATKKTSKK